MLRPLPFPIMIGLLLFYCGTWLIGGCAVFFLLRSVGAHPGATSIAFLGGTSAGVSLGPGLGGSMP